MKKERKGSAVMQRVTVVMSDQYHTLQLVELTTRVRQPRGMDGKYHVDKTAVEAAAHARLVELGKEEPTAPTWNKQYDFVGVLVAVRSGMYAGRIVWATEVEVVEAVKV